MPSDAARPAVCAICRRPLPAPGSEAAQFRPFCSARCKQVDLGRWLAGDYRIPAEPEREGEEDEG